MEIYNTNLTYEEREELREIYKDKYSKGAFIGMLINLAVSTGKSKRDVIKEALQMRILVKDLVNEKTK